MERSTIHERASFLRDFVFAADDGIITTFVVVAGSFGAGLAPSVALTLGFANLLADGFSMATGIYLGAKSEVEYEKSKNDPHWESNSPVKQGLITFVSFDIAGVLPLLPFLFAIRASFSASAALVGLSLFGLGVVKGIYTKKSPVKSGLETFLIGGIAATLAYAVGFLVDNFVV